MSTYTVSQLPPAVNYTAEVPPEDRDPRYAAEAVRLYTEHNRCSFADALEVLRSLGDPVNAWQTAVLAAAERLARIERDDDRAYQSELRRARDAHTIACGRVIYCRQCHKTDCGHLYPKGR